MTKKLIVLLAGLVLLVGCQDQDLGPGTETAVLTNKIINGKVLKKDEREDAPWDQVIGVVDPLGFLMCSATLMSETTVYTAAHCFIRVSEAVPMAVAIMARNMIAEEANYIVLKAKNDTEGLGLEEEELREQAKLTYEQQVESVDTYLTKFLEKQARLMGFYFGDGKEEGKLEVGEYKKIIAKINVNNRYMMTVRQAVFRNLGLKLDRAPGAQAGRNLFKVRDFAEVELSSPVKGVKTLEVVTEAEYQEMLMEENIRFVGYGYRVDQDKAMEQDLMKKMFSGEKFEAPKLKKYDGDKTFEELYSEKLLERYFVFPGAGYPELPEKYEDYPVPSYAKKFGSKRYVDSKIRGVTYEYLISGVKGEESGVCNGDSGGGVFYKTRAGNWRYAGVINFKSVKGCGSDHYPIESGLDVFNANSGTLIVKQARPRPANPFGGFLFGL